MDQPWSIQPWTIHPSIHPQEPPLVAPGGLHRCLRGRAARAAAFGAHLGSGRAPRRHPTSAVVAQAPQRGEKRDGKGGAKQFLSGKMVISIMITTRVDDSMVSKI